MFCGVKKILSMFLALAVLLAPLEFAIAHDMNQMSIGNEMAMQHHDDQSMDHATLDIADQECGSQSLCNDCVYCSPALSVSADVTLEKLDSVLPQILLISRYSIDLPVEFRPPRQL